MDLYNLISLVGLFALLALAWAISSARRCMNWRLIAWGLALQVLLAAFIFLVPAGSTVFLAVNDAVVAVLDSASAGARFVFGPLALAPGQTGDNGTSSLGFILAFQAFPTIIFFSALIAVLYYFRIMPVVIRVFARLFSRLMRISGAESLVASSNIFVGIESTLTVKPYLDRMTPSELCTVLTAGMATVASNVLALYVLSLREVFPKIAGHLVSASLLSAPAAVVLSKIVLPETDRPETLDLNVEPFYERESSLFEAIINAANSGMKMIAGIVALLIAVLGLVALLDLILATAGGWINSIFGIDFQWSLKAICGYLFYPLTLLLGVPLEDVPQVSRIIGERLIVTEVVGYQDLASAISTGALVHRRSAVIATYALCGFAHLASMAIFVGGLCALAPRRRAEIGRIGPRALLAATLACLMTACIVGTFYRDGASVLFAE